MDFPDRQRKSGIKEAKRQSLSPNHDPKTPYVNINDELIRKMTNEYDFSKIIVLNFHLKFKGDAKIKKIEGLSKLVNLEELNLSYNLISYIENLEGLKRLKDLNLAENNIKKIENIDMLTNLEKLNLNGNLIKAIPDSIKSLKKLNTFRLARNRIDDPEKILNIQHLPCLKQFSISDNPINVSPGHVDFCLYLNPHIEVIDSRKITDEHRRTLDKVFLLSQSEENRDINKERMGEIDHLKESGSRLNSDKIKLKEENQRLKKINQEQEEEIKALRDVIDEKNQLLAAYVAKISSLEQEISQYNIDYLYSKLGAVSGKEESSGLDELARIEKTINMLLSEKRENSNKMEGLKQDKSKYLNELTSARNNIQKLQDEVDFMNKKFIKSSNYDQRLSPEKNKRDKELRLASLQVQTEQLREKSLDLETKIEATKDKIRKTSNLLKKTQTANEEESESGVLKGKLEQLNEKLRVYEKSNEEVISAIATADREIRSLGDDIHFDKSHSASGAKALRYSSRAGISNEENNEILRAHYDNEREQLNDLKRKEAELLEKYEKTDLQLEYLRKQVESCEEKITGLQENKKTAESKASKSRKESSQANFDSRREEYSSRQTESPRILKVKILGLLSNLKQVFIKVNNASQEFEREDVAALDEIILALNKDKTDNMKTLEGSVQKISGLLDEFKDKLGDVLEKRSEDNRAYETKIKVLQDKLEQKTKLEKELQQQIAQKELKLERASSRIEAELAQREAKIDELSLKTDDLREKRYELSQALKKLFSHINQHKRRLRSIGALAEAEDKSWDDRIEEDFDNSENLDDMVSKLKKALKQIEKNLCKIETFNNAKSQFLEEYETQLQELGEKWKEYEQKKEDFKQKMGMEREENLQIMNEAYTKLEEERLRLEEDKQSWTEDKKRIERERGSLMDDFNRISSTKEQTAQELRREQEHMSLVKENLEKQIMVMKKEIEALKMDISDYEIKRDKLEDEVDRAMRSNEVELRRQMAVKEEIERVDIAHQKLVQRKEELHVTIQSLEHEKNDLQMQVMGVKNQVQQVEDDFKMNLEKFKMEERSLKRAVEHLNNEAQNKRELLEEFEDTFTKLNEEISVKRHELADFERRLEDFDKEKEHYRKNKLEHVQIVKEMEEARIRMEEMVFKTNLQEENLNTVKSQIESTNLILKEKQSEILILEKRINKLNENMGEYQLKMDQIRMECESKEDDIKAADLKRTELFLEYERIAKKAKEAESYLVSKDGEIEGLETEIHQKTQELRELNEMIEENDSKYRKVIQENRDALDKTLLELREKEEEYHSVLVEMDNLSRQREEIQGAVNKLERECKTKEETLRKLMDNIGHSQSEIERMNDNIITLTEKETSLEERLQKYSEVEQSYAAKTAEIEANLDNLTREEEELENRVLELQQKEDSIYVLMALNGEMISEKAQQRIKKMVGNHFHIQDLRSKMQALENENNQLRQQLTNSYQSQSVHQIHQSSNFVPEDREIVPSFNYRLNFGKGNLANEVSPLGSMRQGNMVITSERNNGTFESMPLRDSTKDNRMPLQERGKIYNQVVDNREMEKLGEENEEDMYNFTGEETQGVNMVLQKIEEARRHINILEQESRRDFKENRGSASALSSANKRRDENYPVEEY